MRKTAGSNVKEPDDGSLTPSSLHGSYPKLDKRQDPPVFSTLSNAFRSAIWIWTPDINDLFNAPAGTRLFRFTYNPSSGKVPTLGEVMITAEDRYSLFVNGALIGRSSDAADGWKTAQGYKMVLPPGPVLFAVSAANDARAGVLVAIRVTHTDGTEAIISSEREWRASITPVSGFESPSTDDSGWTQAKNLVRFGLGPWGIDVTPPTTLTTVVISGTPPPPASVSSPPLASSPAPPAPSASSALPTSPSSTVPLTSPSDSTTFTSIPFTSLSSHLTSRFPISVTTITEKNGETNAPPITSPSSISSVKSNKSTLIGSIVGGIIGGILVLLVIILLLLRRKKRRATYLTATAASLDAQSPGTHRGYTSEFFESPLTAKNTATSPTRSSSFPFTSHRSYPSLESPSTAKNTATSPTRSDSTRLTWQHQYSTNTDTQYSSQWQPPLAQPPPYQENDDVHDGLKANRSGQPSSG